MHVHTHTHTHSGAPREESQPLFGDSEIPDLPTAEETDEKTLWVDKYSPRHYTELLSDDVRQSDSPMCNEVGVTWVDFNHQFHSHGLKCWVLDAYI